MNVWPQRERFKALVKAYRAKHDIDRPTMAARLNVEESYLHGLLYDKRVRPGLDVVQRMSEIFEVSVTELVDDPGGIPPLGLSEEQWLKLSDEKRVLATAILQDLPGIPPGEEAAYLALWKQGVHLGRARLIADQKAGKGGKKP